MSAVESLSGLVTPLWPGAVYAALARDGDFQYFISISRLGYTGKVTLGAGAAPRHILRRRFLRGVAGARPPEAEEAAERGRRQRAVDCESGTTEADDGSYTPCQSVRAIAKKAGALARDQAQVAKDLPVPCATRH